jgi:hypothetical protein
MFRIPVERKRREVDFVLERLRECVEESKDGERGGCYAQEKLRELLSFFELTSQWYE